MISKPNQSTDANPQTEEVAQTEEPSQVEEPVQTESSGLAMSTQASDNFELNNRFAKKSTQLLRCIACLDQKNSFVIFDEDKLVELDEMYVDDFSYMRSRLFLETNLRHSLLM